MGGGQGGGGNRKVTFCLWSKFKILTYRTSEGES